MTAELKQSADTGAPASVWKPYPAYKDSGVEWLGKVPEHWVMKKIKWIFKVINGSTPKTGNPEYWDGDIPWITPDDLGQLHSDTIYEPARKITESGYKNCGTTLVPIGSLVLSTRAPIGHLAIAGIDLCTNQGCRALVFKNNDNARYFYYQLSIARPELESWGQGSTFRELSKNKLESFELFSPEVEEQHSISLYLVDRTRKIDSLVEKKQKMIELLKEERTATINQAVTKGLNPDVPMKDSGIEWLGEVPEHWKVKKLKYIADVVLGKMLTNDDKGGYFYKPYLRAQNIGWQNVNADDIKQMWFSEKELDQYRVKLNDLLVSEGGEVGRTAIWKNIIEECYIQNSVHKVTMLDGNNPHYFLYLFFLYGQLGYFDSIVSRVSIAHLTREKLKEVFGLIPSIGEQEHIVKHIESESAKIDSAVSIIEREILLLQEYRTALISEVVTGKIDVRGE